MPSRKIVLTTLSLGLAIVTLIACAPSGNRVPTPGASLVGRAVLTADTTNASYFEATAQKRDGIHVTLLTNVQAVDGDVDLLALDEALTTLSEVSAERAQIVRWD